MKLAFLGLGAMGSGMARRLLDEGHDVAVWNRSADRAGPLAAAGARVAGSPRAAVEGAEAVVTMLADDAALAAVTGGADGLITGLAEGAVHIACSTVSPDAVDALAAAHAAKGQRFVAAPVFGRPPLAAKGQLSLVVAGAPAAIDAARPVLEALGRAMFVVGETPSAATLVKLAGNFMIMSTAEMIGEAMALAEAGGVSRATLLEVMTGTLFDSPLLKVYGPLLAEQRFRPAGFTAPLGLKDMRLTGDAAAALGVDMPLLAIVKAHLQRAIDGYGTDVDIAALSTPPAG